MRATPKHPSGRPVARREVKGRSIWRIPDDGLVTPKLATDKKDLSLVGFHHEFIEAESDEDAKRRP